MNIFMNILNIFEGAHPSLKMLMKMLMKVLIITT